MYLMISNYMIVWLIFVVILFIILSVVNIIFKEWIDEMMGYCVVWLFEELGFCFLYFY